MERGNPRDTKFKAMGYSQADVLARRMLCTRRGGGGGSGTKFNMGRLRPEVQPLTLFYTILAEKVPIFYTFYTPK